MSDHLPPLPALRAFEAAARLASFSAAAAELNVTPAAISQQIRGLEERYQVDLFIRSTRTISLTATGASVLPRVREGLAVLREVEAQLTAHRDQSFLTVSVYPTMAEKWLIPRLERFRDLHPDTDLLIHATDDLADFTRDGVDIAIRYGAGRYPGYRVIPFLQESGFPVCSPGMAERLSNPEDLRGETLLHAEWRMERNAGANWRIWLKAAHLGDINPKRGLRFTNEAMMLQAAIDGLGVALASSTLADGDLKAGRLVRPFGDSHQIDTEFGHYLVYPAESEHHPKVVAFRDWALAEADDQSWSGNE